MHTTIKMSILGNLKNVPVCVCVCVLVKGEAEREIKKLIENDTC